MPVATATRSRASSSTRPRCSSRGTRTAACRRWRRRCTSVTTPSRRCRHRLPPRRPAISATTCSTVRRWPKPAAEASPANEPAPAFDFDGPAAPAGSAAAGATPPPPMGQPSLDGVDAELLEIFFEEARQCLGDLRRSFGRLAGDLNDTPAWLDLSRHFHLLKGSAGTVGVTTLASTAAELEQRAEAFGEKKRRASPADLSAIRRDAAAMLSGVPDPARRAGGRTGRADRGRPGVGRGVRRGGAVASSRSSTRSSHAMPSDTRSAKVTSRRWRPCCTA